MYIVEIKNGCTKMHQKDFKTNLTSNQQNYINCEKYRYFFLIRIENSYIHQVYE